MAVQIFQNEELNDISFEVEALAEWKELASELGMQKQLDFVKSSESPIPYPFVNRSMEVIFSTLCPKKEDYKEYSKTPIPLEVMKQIAMSVRDKHFDRIEIWYDDKTPDPFAIGITETFTAVDGKWASLKDSEGKDVLFKSSKEAKEYSEAVGFSFNYATSRSCVKYLIGRWADEIRPISELKQLAMDRVIEKYGAELKNKIEDLQQALKKIQENTLLYLSGELTESQLKGGHW